MIDLERFPDYFRTYEWKAKHRLFRYPKDDSRNSVGADLERRFEWVSSFRRVSRKSQLGNLFDKVT